jgi:hypothetical protein
MKAPMLRLLALIAALGAEVPKEIPQEVPSQPEKIVVGVYVNQIYAIDLRANSFGVDLWVWFRWSGKGQSPLETFEIIGGRITSKTHLLKKKLAEGVEYCTARVTVTINKQWDLLRFPFDKHTLKVQIEDTEREAARMIYEADGVNEGSDPDIALSGWKVGKHGHKVADHVYHSNYGDTSIATGSESHYSRYIFTLELDRSGAGRFFKVFFGLFVATLVSWCGFFIRPKDASPRVSVSVGALFAASAVTVAINNQLPDSSGITLPDKLVFLSLGMILLSLFGTVTSLSLHYLGREQAHRKLDKTSLVIFPTLYALGLLYALRM